jgi:hypothetical protein
MDYQVIFNIALGLIGTLGGWFFKSVYDQIRDLEAEIEDVSDHHEKDHREVVQKINDLALSLPEKYVSKGDYDSLVKVMHHRFDKLEEKIDSLKK